MRNKRKTVAILVPMYKCDLTASEKLSLKHLKTHLNKYDKYLIKSSNLNIKLPSFRNISFNSGYFKSVETYSRLLLSEDFYEAFIDYEYILIYQLDALVFSDQLLYWCSQGYDYIGAPWFKSELEKVQIPYKHEDTSGNGGFSLRRVSTFLRVLKKADKSNVQLSKKIFIRFLSLIFKGKVKLKIYRKNSKKIWESVPRRYKFNEDHFWAFEASKYIEEFKIPPVDIGVKFSFEIAPRYCFEKNKHNLPFGCHAWEKYDKAFWNPYLLKDQE